MPETLDPVAPRSPARRTIVKGAAWAVPAVALATAAPAHASSPIPPNGLNGWVTLSRSCSRNPQFSIDGRGNFTGGGANDRGIWTFVPAPGGTAPTFAEIIFYFDRDGWSFANSSGPGWSNLERYPAGDSGAPAGFYAYRTVYTGGWTFVDRPGESQDAWVADSDPYWLENDMPGRCTTVCAYARRTITVNGVTVSFRRGPVCV